LDRFATDAPARWRMGNTAREIAENNYLIRHHTEKLLAVFEEVV